MSVEPPKFAKPFDEAIQARVAEMAAEEEEKVVARVRERIRKEVVGVAAAVFQDVDFERNGRDICIRIRDARKN